MPCCPESNVNYGRSSASISIFIIFNSNQNTLSARNCAANKAATPTVTLSMTYEAAVIYEPFSISPPVSRAKDEKVVKPPQMPTLRKRTSRGES